MGKRHDVIGIKQAIRYEWMQKAANLLLAGLDPKTVRQDLHEHRHSLGYDFICLSVLVQCGAADGAFAESALHATPEGKEALGLLLNNPAFFPFQLPMMTGDFVAQRTDRIDVLRYGLYDELLKIKEK